MSDRTEEIADETDVWIECLRLSGGAAVDRHLRVSGGGLRLFRGRRLRRWRRSSGGGRGRRRCGSLLLTLQHAKLAFEGDHALFQIFDLLVVRILRRYSRLVL